MNKNMLESVQKYHSVDDFFKYKLYNTKLPVELKEYSIENTNKKKMSLMQVAEVKAYLATHIQKRNLDNDDEQLYDKVQGLLNKLSNNNFDDIASEIRDLPYVKRKHFFHLCEKIVLKGVNESNHADTYSKLCSSLIPYYIKEQYKDENNKVMEREIYFRTALMIICQEMFEELVTGKKKQSSSYERSTEYSKLKISGLCKFLAELYNNNVLNDKVIEQCFNTLFSQLKANGDFYEAMSILMINIINKLNKSNNRLYNNMISNLDVLRYEKNGFKFPKVINKFKILEIYDEVSKLQNSTK